MEMCRPLQEQRCLYNPDNVKEMIMLADALGFYVPGH